MCEEFVINDIIEVTTNDNVGVFNILINVGLAY